MASIGDCRSLIEFCRAFEQHRLRRPPISPPSPRSRSHSLNPFCEHSPSAAAAAFVDALLLLLVLVSLSVLSLPSLRLLLHLLSHAPLAYLPAALALALAAAAAIAAWDLVAHHLRKCGTPYCKGLKKAVEFDIQLESEECVRYRPPPPPASPAGDAAARLGGDHKEELEAELRKMAPPNGRTVLVFRAPCGCPMGRMEVWGPKKVRRIKK